MRGSIALGFAALVAGFGVAAPAVAAPPPEAADPAAVRSQLIDQPGRTVDQHRSTADQHGRTVDQQPATETASCRALLVTAATWSGGFYGQVNVTNTGTVPIRWQVTITFPGAVIHPLPGYIVLQSGTSWIIYPPPPPSWNGILPVGATTSFGFMATTTGMVGTPTITCAATPA